MSRSTYFESFQQDLKYSIRTIRKNRAFSAAMVLTLSLGIGANTAMFSVINAVLLRPLEYQDPDRVVLIIDGATPIRAEEITTSSRSFSEIGSFTGFEDLALSGGGEPEMLKGVRVSANSLHILGVHPLLGRDFLPDEDKVGAAPVAMISAELWRRRFGRDRNVVGSTITLAGVATTVIGVLPAAFQFPEAGADIWQTRPSEWSVLAPKSRPLSPFLGVFGRLKPEVSFAQANAELAVLNSQYAAEHPGMLDLKPGTPEVVLSWKENLVSDVRPKLWMLFGALSFVLLIVCANIGSLLLARAASRAREFAVRAAIGAGRGRIVGQLLTESLLLSFFGGALGMALAAASLRAIRSMTFVDLPRASEIHVDASVLGFGAALIVMTGVAFGLVPALVASRQNLAGVLRGSGEGAVILRAKSISPFGSRGLLVVGQVTLSIVLLIGATLLIESLAHLYRVDPGFQPDHVLTTKIALPPARYDTEQKKAAFFEQLVRRTESLPGVRSAAMATNLPMTDQWMGTTVEITGRQEVQLNERPIAVLESITSGYFRTMAIPLKRGRDFTEHDNADSILAVIMNESMARIFWPQYPAGADPIGQHLLIGNEVRPAEIVGITADVHQTGKDMDPKPAVYFPLPQKPPGSAMLAVRTVGDPLSFANAIRAQVWAIDRSQPVSDVSTLDIILETSEGQLRLIVRLLGTFAGLATLLAMIGLYGVVSYSVAQRTKEIGIRRALGAPRRNILALVTRQVMTLAFAGVVLGIATAFACTRLMRDLLFQVSTTDPVAFVGIAILFVIVALCASYIPARRAAAVDPMAALRME